jgi:hypothetical protein
MRAAAETKARMVILSLTQVQEEPAAEPATKKPRKSRAKPKPTDAAEPAAQPAVKKPCSNPNAHPATANKLMDDRCRQNALKAAEYQQQIAVLEARRDAIRKQDAAYAEQLLAELQPRINSAKILGMQAVQELGHDEYEGSQTASSHF